ncbi:hypothetical protein H6G65_18775, partial [Microcystis elabens FACHB-917]|nr:hypothetical protein [Microcystis elabens FACHB-917]
MIVPVPAAAHAPYAGRRVSLATCHGKERVLARPFRSALGLTVVVARGFNTDRLGTFSGERPRPADAPETCQRKAEAAEAIRHEQVAHLDETGGPIGNADGNNPERKRG